MAYTKQDWIDDKVALEGNPEKKDKANRFFRSVYPECKAAEFASNYYIYDKELRGRRCFYALSSTTLPVCDIDDIVWEENPALVENPEKVLRFKTEKEFIEEYGIGWRNKSPSGWSSLGGMDCLFGKFKSEADTSSWCIDDWMLTDKPLPKEELIRFKTEKEFLEEYGDFWEYNNSWRIKMTNFYGKVIESDTDTSGIDTRYWMLTHKPLPNEENRDAEKYDFVEPKKDVPKPPLGLMPRNVWLELRRDEVKLAIVRYLDSNKSIPTDWVTEYNNLTGFTNK